MSISKESSNLQKILKQYLSYFPEEKDRLSKLSGLVNLSGNSSDIFDRKNFLGHITASGFIYNPLRGELLLLEHKSLKKFLQPGGHVENIDSGLLSAAKREVFEETGLRSLKLVSLSDDINVPFDIDSHFIPKNDKKGEDEHYHHDFRYLFITDNSNNVEINPDESNGYKWVKVSNLEKTKELGGIVRKIRALLAYYS